MSACGGIGRRTCLRCMRETMGVRVPPRAPNLHDGFDMKLSCFLYAEKPHVVLEMLCI